MIRAMRILLIEDDRKAARLLARGLQEEGFVVDVVHTAEEGDEEAFVVAYDLIVLDWMLPGKDGLTLCRDLRQRGCKTPVLMLTARDALSDRVAGLNTGADDYLTKPFAFDELLARVRALLRRSELVRPMVLSLVDLSLDPMSQRVLRGGSVLELTHKEFAILQILLRHAGEVVSRSRLAEQVWKDDLIAIDNLIDVHISNLRRKVDAPPAAPLIQTVRGRGFRLALADDGSTGGVAHA
ncbi:response regulator transcription factor [Variovorax sp. 2RAF20]|jgi:DNA-binding response OmpR family regulator